MQVVVPCLDDTVSESFNNALACAERPLMPSVSLTGWKSDGVCFQGFSGQTPTMMQTGYLCGKKLIVV